MTLDLNNIVFVVYIATITSEIIICLKSKAQIALLKAKEAFVSILVKLLYFVNVFSEELAVVLLKYTNQ